MIAADLSNLVVEVLHNRGDDNHPDWSVGSGFFIGRRLVLTALHNVDGSGELLVRVHGTEERPAVVRLQGDEDIVDLAILEVSDVEVDVPPLRYGKVDRSAPAMVERCWAVGFPRFKERAHDPKPLRLSAQVDGVIPTGENLGQPLLTLQVSKTPRPLPSSAIRESEWAGMSGATVFSGNNIIVGVITEHHLPEGESALTVVPITALHLLPVSEALKWWKHLGVDPEALVRLPSAEGQLLNYFNDVQRRWLEREVGHRERIFRDDLSQHFDGIPSPLSDFWSHFIKAPGWHEKVQDLLNNMHENAKKFPELASLALSLKQIDCGANYDAILADLRQLFANHVKTVEDVITNLRQVSQQLALQGKKEIDELRDSLRHAEQLLSDMHYLDAQTKSPSFQRCFLFIGSIGAGKTHFIASLLATSPTQNKSFLLLNLSLSSDRSLDEQILQGINKATDTVWSSLKEFNGFLKGGKRMRLVISIDDLHKWLSSRQRLKDLIDVISSSTDLNNIYWLIATEDTSYDKVAGESENHFWQVYSYRPKKEEHQHLNAKAQERLISIGGWLDLDELNRSRKIGLELLRQKLSSKSEDDLWALQMLDERADAMRYLSSPFIAWILWDLRKELPLSRVVNLNFIEFITYYWRKLRSVIDPSPLSLEQVQQCILLITEFLAQTDDLAPNRTLLLNRIQKAAIDRYELQDRHLAEVALAILERGPLLARKRADLESELILEERTEIRFEPFWEYQLAVQLLHETVVREFAGGAWSEIEEWFCLPRPQGIKQGVFEFLLLLLDRNINHNSSQVIDNMLRLGIDAQESLTAAIWFAGPKLSVQRQRSLAALAATLTVYTNSQNLFAFMYFVSESDPQVLDIPSRLALLQPHYKAIHEAGLVNYYLSIVERLFMKLQDNTVVLSCMIHFSGCEIMEITPILAELTIKRLAQNIRGKINVQSEMKGLLDIVLKYLRVDYKKNKQEYLTGSNATSQVRYFYRQWILCEFCRALVDSVGLSAYDLLAKHYWYKSWKLQIGYPTSLEMRQEANLALGAWYRNEAWGVERKHYVELIKKLANSPDPEDRITAFFLIRHTELTEGRRGVRVDRAFHPLLRTLFTDPELQKITESYYEDFQANLNDIDSLADLLVLRRHFQGASRRTYHRKTPPNQKLG